MNITLIIITAISLLILVGACWRVQRWVSTVALSLAVGGAFMFIFRAEYFEFSFYLFQMLLVLLGTAFFVRGRNQKLLLGLSTVGLVAAGLIKDSLHLDHLATVEYAIYLYAAYALLPLLFYSPVQKKEENLEKIMCFQQTWLRISFLYWSTLQGINISHYDLYRRFVFEFGWLALVVILFGVLLRRRLFWTLAQQSVLSLLVLSVALDKSKIDSNFIYAWVMLLALSVLLPKTPGELAPNGTKFLKRIEFGAFGGGVFWSLILVVHFGSTSSMEGSMLWTFIVFLVGLFSWMRQVPSPEAEQQARVSHLFLLGARVLVQILLVLVFMYPFR